MWRSVQAGSRGSAKGAAAAPPLGRWPTLSKLPLRGDVDAAGPRGRGYVAAALALLALFLLTGTLTLQNRSPNLFKSGFKHVTDLTTDTDSSNGPTPTGCDQSAAKLKVFMYDLPPEFHFGMITDISPPEIWPKNLSDIPRYPGGLYQQHSPEYWLITDVLTSDMPDRTSPCTAFRVRRWQDADVILVPFFASLSYNKYSRPGGKDRNQELQETLLAFLKTQPAWREAEGVDHVVVIHHPNSMVHLREQFRRAMFVVADFGRYGAEVANLRKDVVAPYKHVIPRYDDDNESAASFGMRSTLLFFQGTIVRKEGGIIRRELYELLRAEPDVVFATGATTNAGIRSATAGMRGSKFCLHLAGDTPSSNRLFDAVVSHCVPLVISDEIELPFEDVLDYSEFCLFVNSTQALQKGFVTDLLRKFREEEWARMHARMVDVQRHFEYQHPSEVGDAVHMTWDAIARKVPALTLARNKRLRHARSQIAPNLLITDPTQSP